MQAQRLGRRLRRENESEDLPLTPILNLGERGRFETLSITYKNSQYRADDALYGCWACVCSTQ